jgi:hypothetical protein
MSQQPPTIPDLRDHDAVLAYLSEHAASAMLAAEALIFFLAPEDDKPPIAVVIDDMPPSAPQHERVELIAAFLPTAGQAGCTDFVLVVCRSGSAWISGDDLAWHDAAYGVRRPDAPRCQGVYVAARGRVLRVEPEPSRRSA